MAPSRGGRGARAGLALLACLGLDGDGVCAKAASARADLFWRQGFLRVPGFADEREVAQLRSAMASLLQSWQKTAASGDGLAEASLSSLRSEGQEPDHGFLLDSAAKASLFLEPSAFDNATGRLKPGTSSGRPGSLPAAGLLRGGSGSRRRALARPMGCSLAGARLRAEPPAAEPPAKPPPAPGPLGEAAEEPAAKPVPPPEPSAAELACAEAPDPAALAAGLPGGYRFLPGPMPALPGEFSVVSMNILAASLASSHGYCKPEHLNWESRRQRLLEGLVRAVPDLILLQEVQGTFQPTADNHFGDIAAALGEAGYFAAAYARLTTADGKESGGEASKARSQKRPRVGNAVFARTSAWEKLGEGRIAFAALLSARGVAAGAEGSAAEGQQVAAWARLRHNASGLVVIAVSVHVCAGSRHDKQVAQVHAMLHCLGEEVLQPGDALLVGGDFNSLPGSGACRLLSEGALPADHADLLQAPDAGALYGPGGPAAPPGLAGGLRSAYAALQGTEPELTWAAGGAGAEEHGTLDYLWFSPGLLEPVPGSLLPTPTLGEARAEGGGLLGSGVPSDHAPVGAVFRPAAPPEEDAVVVVEEAASPRRAPCWGACPGS